VVYDPAKGEVFVANIISNNVSVINDTDDRVVAWVPVGVCPSAAAYDPATGEVFVANLCSNNVSVISDATDAVVATVPVGGSPDAAVYDAAKDQVFVANSGSNSVSVLSVPRTYTVTFAESGLPPSTLAKDGWTADLNGSRVWSTGSTISFPGIPNGTYGLLVTGPSGYRVSLGTFHPGGTVSVSGTTVLPASFEKGTTLQLMFTERGLARDQTWCVALDNATSCSTGTNQRFGNLTPTGLGSGTYAEYTYRIASPLVGQGISARIGPTGVPDNGTLNISASVTIAYKFVYGYLVVFTESGAPTGNWSVTVGKTTLSNSTGEVITFSEPNGTYSYRIASISGYISSGTPRRVTISGRAVTVAVTFAVRTESPYPPVAPMAPSGGAPGVAAPLVAASRTLSPSSRRFG